MFYTHQCGSPKHNALCFDYLHWPGIPLVEIHRSSLCLGSTYCMGWPWISTGLRGPQALSSTFNTVFRNSKTVEYCVLLSYIVHLANNFMIYILVSFVTYSLNNAEQSSARKLQICIISSKHSRHSKEESPSYSLASPHIGRMTYPEGDSHDILLIEFRARKWK